MQASEVVLSVNGFYGGGFLHADDIRTLVTSEASLKAQIVLVDEFARSNCLKFNISKREVVVLDRDRRAVLPTCEVDGSVLPAGDMGKCLEYWWKCDLLTHAVENIMKARCVFFHYGSIGVFQGDLSPGDLLCQSFCMEVKAGF